MKIQILKTFKASIDGHNLEEFLEGEILDKNDFRLTEHFINWINNNKSFAKSFVEEKMFTQIKNKAILNAPENKSLKIGESEETLEEISSGESEETSEEKESKAKFNFHKKKK